MRKDNLFFMLIGFLCMMLPHTASADEGTASASVAIAYTTNTWGYTQPVHS